MDVLYELYDKDIQYDNLYGTQDEKEIIDFINTHKDKEKFKEDVSKMCNSSFQNELSIRHINMINWYPLVQGKKVLEVLGRFGAITEWLLSKDMEVTCIETVKERAEANNARNNCKNLQIICTSALMDIELNEKYDYIILPNVIENIKSFMNVKDISPKSAVKLLITKISKYLNDDGKILIYTDNKFAIRNFAGYKSSSEEVSYSNITGSNKGSNNRYFSKKELCDIFSELGINDYKFYYLLPDCKNTSVIYSDDYLPSISSSKLKYNICYNKFNTIIFNETDAILQVTNSGYFDIFANSYMIEIAREKCDINFVSFNNFRENKYQLITTMKKEEIVKIPVNENEQFQIANIKKNIDLLKELKINTVDTYDDECIKSKYTNARTLDKIIADKLLNEGEKEFVNEIKKWYEYVDKKLIKVDNNENLLENSIFKKYNIEIEDEVIQKFNFVKTGLIDIIFENVFVINDEYYVYDQEWYEENVPLEYILYRAIQSLYFHNKKIHNEFDKEELFKLFGIDEYIKLFDLLEQNWQNAIIDRDVLSYFESTYEATTTLEELKNTCNDADFYRRIMNEQASQIKTLTEENNNLKVQLRDLQENVFQKMHRKIFRRKDD